MLVILQTLFGKQILSHAREDSQITLLKESREGRKVYLRPGKALQSECEGNSNRVSKDGTLPKLQVVLDLDLTLVETVRTGSLETGTTRGGENRI